MMMAPEDESLEYIQFLTEYSYFILFLLSRAATIKSATAGKLWAMDRQTFRRILLKAAFKKRKMYESLLNNVPMLNTLQVNKYIQIQI